MLNNKFLGRTKKIDAMKKYHIHNEQNSLKIGDIVKLREYRPLIKSKKIKTDKNNKINKTLNIIKTRLNKKFWLDDFD